MSKLQKLVLIVGFFSLTVTILLLGLAPSATSYEISVYVAFDQFSWLTLSMAIACGLIILVHAIIVPARSKIWVSALFLVLLSNALILILPILRGYFFYGNGDPLTHLSIIDGILQTGKFQSTNFYPISHILIVAYTYILGSSPENIMLWAPLLLFALFVFPLYSLSKLVFTDLRIQIAIVTVGTVFLFGYQTEYVPNGVAIAFVPFIIFCYFISLRQKDKPAYVAPLLIMVIFIPLVHILVAIYLFLILIMLHLMRYIFKSYYKGLTTKIEIPSSNLLLIALVSILAWMSSFILIWNALHSFTNFFMGELSASPADELGSKLSSASISTQQFITELFIQFGSTILVFLICMIGIVLWLRANYETKVKFFFPITFLISAITISILLFIIPSGVDFYRPIRLLGMPLIFMGGVTIWMLINKQRTRRITVAVLLSSLLIATSMLGILGVFASPLTMTPNPQVTISEISGWNEFIVLKNTSLGTDYITSKDTYTNFVFGGSSWTFTRPDLVTSSENRFVGNHFEDLDNQSESYIVITKDDEITYLDVWQNGRFDANDFNGIALSPSISKIMDNGDVVILLS